MREDRELQEFRDLMRPPERFESGFGWGAVFMALFVGLVMAPSQLYVGLVAGNAGTGGAANWVTVILYVEISRRAFKRLRRPEIFVLWYMCSAVMVTAGQGLLWRQFLAQSEEIRKIGLTDYIPAWYAPTDENVLNQRSFLVGPWLMPLGLMLLTWLITRIDRFGLGYLMFRLTSDVERLPFPMAPVGAMGITALADASSQKETWRWRTFALGAMTGIVFGAVYLAIPNITAAVFTEGIQILPLPFVDLTSFTEKLLPAMPVMISFNLGLFMTGMVMPFWAVMGTLVGLIVTMIANPILHHTGVLDSWREGIGAIQTIQSNTMDFYFSFTIGLSLAVAIIGFIHVFSSFRKKAGAMKELSTSEVTWKNLFKPPTTRGDIPIWISIGIYFFSTTSYVVLSYWLVNHASGPLRGGSFPLWILIFYGFVYTPVMSYVSARLEGIVGQQAAIPYVREATFVLSGYKGAAIWFAPIPLHAYANQVVMFRQTELTGTRFTSLIKAELIIFPVMFVGTILFSQFIWSIGPVPSELFPYANEFWELQAYREGLMWSATLPGESASPFREAFRPEVIAAALGLALSVYFVLDRFGLPIFLVYGVVYGLNQTDPSSTIPLVLGAVMGRFVFRKRFGDNWPRYRIVFTAGFGAGVGLIAMFSMGIVLMAKSVIKLPV